MISEFFDKRNLTHIKATFALNKIDNKKAGEMNDQNLLELGFVYEDIIVYCLHFGSYQDSK